MFSLKYLIIISLILINLSTINANIISDNDDDYPWQSLLQISNETIVKAVMPRYFDSNLLNDTKISEKCRRDMLNAFDDLYKRHAWSYKLFDSWSRSIPSGLMIGTYSDLGNYDQCMSIINESIRTKYCIIDMTIRMPQPMPVPLNLNHHFEVIDLKRIDFAINDTIFNDLIDKSTIFYYFHFWIAICVPDSCGRNDIEYSINKSGIYDYGFALKSLPCTLQRQNDRIELNYAQIICIIIIIAAFSMALISTILYDKQKKTVLNLIFKWFSLPRNTSKLLSFESSKNQDELSCLHGVRFISMFWIIASHTIRWNPWNIFQHSNLILDDYQSLATQPKFHGHYSVETFFFMSGLLTSYITFKYTQGDYRNFGYISFILIRYLRLTPQLMIYMLLIRLALPLIDGPTWTMAKDKIEYQCSTNWWRNILYIQNLYAPHDACALHTWYLAADMQLHVMSTIFVALFLWDYQVGMIATKLLIGSFIIISGVWIYFDEISPGFIITYITDFSMPDLRMGPLTEFFFLPWLHVSTFFIGLIVGVQLQNRSFWYNNKSKHNSPDQDRSNRMPFRIKLLYWMAVITGTLFCFYCTYPWLNGQLSMNPLISAILLPVSRIVWAAVLTLIVWLCINDNGLFIDKFLSWPLFRPFSRITYCVYLVHELVILFALKTRRNLFDYRSLPTLLLIISVCVFSYILGFIFTLLFESPLINVINYYRYWHEQRQQQQLCLKKTNQIHFDGKINDENNGNNDHRNTTENLFVIDE